MRELLQLKSHGLIGPGERFHVDAWSKADVNLVTHAHGDHARYGSREYWCTRESVPILKHRLGDTVNIKSFEYGERIKLGDTWISFHPAGHILGSAQVRIEDAHNPSNVWVVTGDYKRDDDPTCRPFEVVPCRTLITEATFALPIYNWAPTTETAREIYEWWQWNKSEGHTAVLFCYALGKAQRVLAELTAYTDEEVLLHGAMIALTDIYRAAGVKMLPTKALMDDHGDLAGRLVLAPPSAHRSPWMKRFKALSTGFASGWMAVRGIRRGRSYEKGFVLSDHADWSGLVRTVEESQAERVLVTHGSSEILAHYLRESRGLEAEPLTTRFGDEEDG